MWGIHKAWRPSLTPSEEQSPATMADHGTWGKSLRGACPQFPHWKNRKTIPTPGLLEGSFACGSQGSRVSTGVQFRGPCTSPLSSVGVRLAHRYLCFTGGPMILTAPGGPSHMILAPITCSSHGTWCPGRWGLLSCSEPPFACNRKK